MAEVTSLGIGSGVLTADVIDQLKEADESRIIKPFDNKITSNTQKQEGYTLLSSLMTSFKTSASSLSFSTVFENKTVKVSGNADVTVEPGTNVESFTLETLALAQKDITKLGAIASASVPIASGDGVLDINGTTVSYDATTTLEDLAQAITDANTDANASILQTGDGEYSLVLTSKTTGADQTLTIADTGGLLDAALFAAYDATTNPTGYEKVQTAQDAEFKFNGITTTRSTNEIDDLIFGMSLTLKEEGDISNVEISQDTETITEELQLFVDSYNALMTNLSDMTVSDLDAGVKGVFSGDSFIKSIARDLNSVLTSVNGSNQSLFDYGIDIARGGAMSFDKNVLETKLQEDPDAVQLFFSGGEDANGNTKIGFFETLDDKIKEYTGYGKLLSGFENDLKTEASSLQDSRSRAQETLNTRYEIMTKRFVAYDAIISKINAQFSSLQMMINAEANAN